MVIILVRGPWSVHTIRRCQPLARFGSRGRLYDGQGTRDKGQGTRDKGQGTLAFPSRAAYNPNNVARPTVQEIRSQGRVMPGVSVLAAPSPSDSQLLRR